MWALAANQATLKAVGDFSWFDWVKRASLILGFLVLVSLDSDRFRRATWPVVTAQVVLFANVFEAGIFGCLYSDYFRRHLHLRVKFLLAALLHRRRIWVPLRDVA